MMPGWEDVRTGPLTEVDRPALDVMFIEVGDVPSDIRRGWDELERRVGPLRGRTFIGAFDAGRYRATTVIREGDDPHALRLETGTIAGGRYARRRLRGEPDVLYAAIAPTMELLTSAVARVESRMSLEWYRRLDEVDLLVPILPGGRARGVR